VAVNYLDDAAPDPRTETPAGDDARELTRELERALASIRPDYRTAFVLFHEHGQSYEAIAATMQRPVGTVKTWLHRARLELLDALRRRGMVGQNSGEFRMDKVE
jgi:RNA polymerase sigma-70 factor (ECF subfamily)